MWNSLPLPLPLFSCMRSQSIKIIAMSASFSIVTIVIIIIVVILTAPSEGWMRDSLAQIRDIPGNLGRVATLGDKRELLANLIKSLVSGNCHPAMKRLVQQQPYDVLSVPQSRTVLGKRRSSVIGAITFNRWSAYYSDSEESWFLYLVQVQRAESGPVIEYFENLHHQLYTLQSVTVNRVD